MSCQRLVLPRQLGQQLLPLGRRRGVQDRANRGHSLLLNRLQPLPPCRKPGLHFVFDIAHDFGLERLQPRDANERHRLQSGGKASQHVGGAARRQMRDHDGRRLRVFADQDLRQFLPLRSGRGKRTEAHGWTVVGSASAVVGDVSCEFGQTARDPVPHRSASRAVRWGLCRTNSFMICCCSRGSMSPNSRIAFRTRAASSAGISSSNASAAGVSRLETRIAALRSVLCFIRRHLQSRYAERWRPRPDPRGPWRSVHHAANRRTCVGGAAGSPSPAPLFMRRLFGGRLG